MSVNGHMEPNKETVQIALSLPPNHTCAQGSVQRNLTMHPLSTAQEVPLTFAQQIRLLSGCLPVVFFTLALVFVLTRFEELAGSLLRSFLYSFVCALILSMGWIAVNCLRDLLSGVALIQEDVLELAWRAGRTARSRDFYGKFTQLGKMRLIPSAYHQGIHGFRYRICYSPVSKIVWSLEKVG